MATPKQEKLIRLILDNIGARGLTKTMGELLAEAGYSESIQKNPYLILNSETIQEGLVDVANDMDKIRRKALNELMARDIEKEPYRDVVKAVDVMTKNHQLLTGGDTERVDTPVLVKIIRNDGKTTDSDRDTGGV